MENHTESSMDVLLDLDSSRRRIAILENDLKTARAATEEAEALLESTQAELKNSEHARHAARNLETYGHSDEIIFVQSEDLDQGLIYRLANGKGSFTSSVCRVMVRYNIDQFLQRPVLHQWLQNGKLYREAHELQSSRFELFFDLLFVGMVHQISEAAAEQPTGLGFAKYVLTFAPAFSIWGDVRDIANQFANDDVTQRSYILWIMILLVGYSNNASSIDLEPGIDEGEIFGTINLKSVQWTLGFFVVAKISRVMLFAAIISFAYSLFLPYSRRPLQFSAINPLICALLFFIAIFTPFHVTIALVAVGTILDILLRILGVLAFRTVELLGKKYDKRRQKHIRRQNSDSCPLTPQVEKDQDIEPSTDEALRTVNSSTTAVNEEALMGLEEMKICKSMAARQTMRFPALNIEHHVERLGAFVTIVLGEMVVGVFFTTSGSVGLNMESGRALLSLMIAFNFNWLYFGSPATKHFIHAIRRHWFSGCLFTTLHLPLCMALLLASSAINRLVTSAQLEADDGMRWFFGAGLGVSMCTMATLGFLHKSLDTLEGLAERERRHFRKIPRRTISRRVVLGMRYVAGVAMALVPLAKNLSTIQFLSVYVGITAFLIIEETFARVEKREQELDWLNDAGDLE